MKYIVQIFVAALVLWMSGSSYWYVCKIKGASFEKISASASDINMDAPVSNTASITILKVTGIELDLVIEDDILFNSGTADAVISEEITDGLNKVFQHLDEYTTHGIEITGNYDDLEKNKSILENLGIARAQSIKNIFIDKGLDRGQISTISNKQQKINIKNGKASGIIVLRIYALEELSDEDKKHLAHIEQALRSESKMVFFRSGEDELELDDELRTYFSELNLFMHHHGHHSITLIGHTDNIGGEKENDILGLHRAEFVKKTLVGAGIHADQIHTISKGENNPIATNETEEGRSKDRRVEIIMN